MVLAVCTKDLRFYKWPSIKFLGCYEVPVECTSVKAISWCCNGKDVLVIKSKGEPLLIKAPSKSDSKIATQKLVSVNNASTGTFSKTNSAYLALGLENGDVSTFDFDSKEFLRYKKLPTGIQNLDFSFDDQILLAGCFDGNLFLYDKNGRPTASFIIPNSQSLSTTHFSKYSDILAGASKDGTLAVWNAETTNLLFHCKEHSARITDFAFLENTVTSVSADGYLCIFDLRTHDLVSKCNLDGALSSLAYFPESYDLAVGTYNQLRSYDSRNLSTPLKTLLISNSGHIKKISAIPHDFKTRPQSTKTLFQSVDRQSTSKRFDEDISASGDFSVHSPMSSKENLNVSKENMAFACVQNQIKPKAFRRSEVLQLENFVDEIMSCTAAQFSERMAHAFYTLRINTSKQFICMGEKMDENWQNFISYLNSAVSEKTSSAESLNKDKSESGSFSNKS